MVGVQETELPFVVAFGTALALFAVLVPWLVHESRRPVAWPVAAPPRRHPHVRIPSLLVAARCFGMTVARRMEPTPDAVVSQWQTANTAARTRAVVLTAETSMEGDDVSPRAWSPKRERQYEHIKTGLEQRGETDDVAEEIAARTVDKERARAGEAKQRSRSSTHDISSGRRGGLRSHRGPGGRTKEQLYNDARHKNIKGRSKMSKAQLARAVGR